jgi:beta-galactosidase beta subunit
VSSLSLLSNHSLTIIKAVYWVETKGKTLEEIDAIFEGEKHSSVPDVELVRQGKETIDVGEVEQQIVAEVLATKTDRQVYVPGDL